MQLEGFYPFNGYGLTEKRDIVERELDVSCPGYQAIEAAKAGAIGQLQAHIVQTPQDVNSLHRISTLPYYYTPLHMAAISLQWAACAVLWNSGANWAIASQVNGEHKKTPIDYLNSTPKSLVYILQRIVKQEVVNVDALLCLLTHPTLLVDRRREVLEDRALCLELSAKVTKESALVLMAALLIGSHKYRKSNTGFQKTFQNAREFTREPDLLKTDHTISNFELLLYASYLAGQITAKELAAHVNKIAEESSALSAFIENSDYTFVSKYYGCSKCTDETRLSLNDTTQRVKLVFFARRSSSIEIFHAGIAYHTKERSFLIHISKNSGSIVCEELKRASIRESLFAFIGMLPWVAKAGH